MRKCRSGTSAVQTKLLAVLNGSRDLALEDSELKYDDAAEVLFLMARLSSLDKRT